MSISATESGASDPRKSGWTEGLGEDEWRSHARVYADIEDPRRTRSLHLRSEVKHDEGLWHSSLKLRYLNGIIRSLSFNPYTTSHVLSTSTDKTTICSDKTTTLRTSVRVVYLLPDEWKYWSRRFRRDCKTVVNLTYFCGIPQANGTIAIITHDFFQPIGGRVYEGEAAREAVLVALNGHDHTDQSRRIRATRGRPLRSSEDRRWQMVAYTQDDVDSLRKKLKDAEGEGIIRYIHYSHRDDSTSFSFEFLVDPDEGRKKLGMVNHVPKNRRKKIS